MILLALIFVLTLSAGVIEYTDCTSAEGKDTSNNECPEFDTKLSDGEASVSELWWMWSTFSLPLLPGPFWPGVVVLVRDASIRQIELFNHLLYLKPFNSVQTNEPSVA